MTKQKKSFFEKLTGIQKIDDESEIEINSSEEKKREIPAADEEYRFPAPEEKDDDDFFGDPKKPTSQEEEEVNFSQEIEKEAEENFVSAPAPKVERKIHPKPVDDEKDEDDDSEADAEGQLTIDVYQTDRDIVIKSTIAGVKAEDLDIDINSEMVTIKGKRTQDDEVDSESYYYQECYWGPFSRSIILPVEIVTEKAEASMKNGILSIRLPKMEVAKTRKLQVRGF